MQTVSVPYTATPGGAALIRERRRVYSAAVRSAYANARRDDGSWVAEKDLRHALKARFAPALQARLVDAWTLHCATLEGRETRKARPDGDAVFGGAKTLDRRRKGLITRDEWREKRLLPFCTRGDASMAGNRHFRLSADARTCTFAVYGETVTLNLAAMRGNAEAVLRQAAALAAAKRVNVQFRIDSTHLHVTVDPQDLPDHPERRRPVLARPGRGRDRPQPGMDRARRGRERRRRRLARRHGAARPRPGRARAGARRVGRDGARDVGRRVRSRRGLGPAPRGGSGRAGEGTGQVAVERQGPLPQPAPRRVGPDGVRGHAPPQGGAGRHRRGGGVGRVLDDRREPGLRPPRRVRVGLRDRPSRPGRGRRNEGCFARVRARGDPPPMEGRGVAQRASRDARTCAVLGRTPSSSQNGEAWLPPSAPGLAAGSRRPPGRDARPALRACGSPAPPARSSGTGLPSRDPAGRTGGEPGPGERKRRRSNPKRRLAEESYGIVESESALLKGMPAPDCYERSTLPPPDRRDIAIVFEPGPHGYDMDEVARSFSEHVEERLPVYAP